MPEPAIVITGPFAAVDVQALPQRVPKPDIVITSYEAAASDAAALKAISWEAAVLDERQRGRTGIAKVLCLDSLLKASCNLFSCRFSVLHRHCTGRRPSTGFLHLRSPGCCVQAQSALSGIHAAFKLLIPGTHAQVSSPS